MYTKLAACDPCRFSKLACDHARPACGRCESRGSSGACVYRTRPFKKRRAISRAVADSSDLSHPSSPPQVIRPVPTDSGVSTLQYPNPGFLGQSSHTTIFQNLPLSGDGGNSWLNVDTIDLESSNLSIDDNILSRGRTLIEAILQHGHMESYVLLVDEWTTRYGVSLSLATSFIMPCARSAARVLSQVDGQTGTIRELARKLSYASAKPTRVQTSCSADDFICYFSGGNTRWETIGLFFTAVSRATIDVTDCEALYTSNRQREHLRRTAMRFADVCLDIALSLDRLNDLQLILQYENFINHSFVDGDQSYNAWKRLGDVISSIYALGYHEKLDMSGKDSELAIFLRESVVARAYSADKNVSIFLGRPPRMIRRYCTFHFVQGIPSEHGEQSSAVLRRFQRFPEQSFDYSIDTWWSFHCAILKEKILELSHETDLQKKHNEASTIKEDAQAQWLLLPEAYRYKGDLKSHHHKSIERDFIASARLNHLHVFFMLHLVFAREAIEHYVELLTVCTDILNLVVRIAVIKARLTNSGTGLIWKICHYGLPAAGIICLSLLHPSSPTRPPLSSRAKVLQDLSVLVAQVDSGILIESTDPDYAILFAATTAIQGILDKVLSEHMTETEPSLSQSNVLAEPVAGSDILGLWSTNDIWDFEADFWTNLADHPVLAGNLQAD